MKFSISKIILWPKDQKNQKRIISFSEDKINVITGQSQTGKSSIISIIDYCLGSGKCTIPVGIIREKVAWFGVLIKLENHEILVARKEPGDQIQTSELYIDEGRLIIIPESIEKNSNVSVLKKRLNQISNLSSFDLSTENVESAFKGNAPSFRDFAAFNFQPQHIVANPYTLFFKADTYEHQEKLKAIFPLALGVVDSSIIAVKHELKLLEKDLNVKRRELESRKRANDVWKKDLNSYFNRAIALDIISIEDNEIDDTSKEMMLRKIIHDESVHFHEIKSENTDIILSKISKINHEESEISQNIQRYRYKLSKLEIIIQEKKELGDSLKYKEDRLSPTEWLIDNIKQESECPLCGTKEIKSFEILKKMKDQLKQISEEKIRINENNTVLDKEILETRKLLSREEIRINELKRHKRILEGKSDTVKKYQVKQNEIFRFIGNIEKTLENNDYLDISGELVSSIAKLEESVISLRAKLSLVNEDEKLQRKLRKFSTCILKYLEILDIERPNDPVELDIKDLTLKILSSNRMDYLWEIGSGANWMGYHVASLLALHEVFLSNQNSPVPSFLIFDQPSQVYFPDIWPGDPNPKGEDKTTTKIESDDILRVENIFKSISKHVSELKGKNQIIVIDHADEITWKSTNNIHLVGRWRNDDDFLIPNNWIQELDITMN